MAASARHETRALLRAHLAAASSYRHRTRHCPVCHRLLRLAMDSAPRTAPQTSETSQTSQVPQAAQTLQIPKPAPGSQPFRAPTDTAGDDGVSRA
ncbi:DUF6274 family protein [Streptomyces sp. F-3]|uniref:DUF6274 family protein n=1 Tax=Streptomyces sp. F-3 TaxID=1840095 RepID=UPI0009A084DA|nr:DUF6274 family protein [Streptomyces sp. F-3]